MKKLTALVVVLSLGFTHPVYAQSWLDSIKSALGFGEETEQTMPSVKEMVGILTESLDVNQSQAEGGLGSIFNYVKGNVSADQFSQLSDALPGIGEIIKSAPDVSKMAEGEGLSGLLDKASEYSESLKAVNDVKKQFESLGLSPEMIAQFVQQAQSYLDTEQGQQAKQLLSEGLGKLLG